jgi:hypothetical protein
MKIETKLNVCPKCKSKNVVLHRNFDFVECKDCYTKGQVFDGHPEDAVNSWNSLSNKKNTKIPLGGFNPLFYRQFRIGIILFSIFKLNNKFSININISTSNWN